MMPTRFWNREYLFMCLMHLLVALSVSMQFLLIPLWHPAGSAASVALCVSLFGLGMFLLGPMNGYFVDAFRRKTVCGLSLFTLAFLTILLPFCKGFFLLALVRLLQGAAIGVFQMSMGSTLINDLSISKRRTATDYFYTWFGLLGLPLGVAVADYLHPLLGVQQMMWGAAMLPMVAALLLFPIKVPFRAPDNVPLFSTDRFFHRKALPLVVGLLPAALVAGVFLGSLLDGKQMLFMAAGVLAGLLTHRLFFVEADNRADGVAGLLLGLASVVLFLNPGGLDMQFAASLLMGLGLSWFSSRMLLYFLKISDHCQRGTLQHTYMLSFTLGMSGGYLLEFLCEDYIFILVGGLLLFALLYFLLIVHPWFVRRHGREFRFKEI